MHYPDIDNLTTSLITMLREKILLELQKIDALADYISLQARRSVVQQDSIDLEEAVYDFLQSPRKVLGLLGDSGSGKSLFCQRLTLQLWDKKSFHDPIPLFISLPALQNPKNRMIEETLAGYGLNDSQIEQLKENQTFIFILDAYDELNQRYNLYVTNKLHEWKAKIIIACRIQYLASSNNYENYFLPFNHQRPQRNLYQELIMAPFISEQIDAYLQQYVQHHETPWKDWQKYHQVIDSIPNLPQLIATPFLLKIAVEVLPLILKRYETQPFDSQQRFTQAALYDVFIGEWFERQLKKIKLSNTIDNLEELKINCWKFAKELAMCMKEKQVSQVTYSVTSFSKENPDSELWKKFFDEQDKQVVLVRTACPLRKIGKNQYAFLHDSLIDYFASKVLQNELTPVAASINPNNNSEADNSLMEKTSSEARAISSEKDPLLLQWQDHFVNQRLITDQPRLLQFLADRIEEDNAFKNILLKMIKLSKLYPEMQVAAANAITILNQAQFSLSNFDFSNSRIAHANLNNAVLDYSDFSYADLSYVKLASASLRYTNFSHAQMQNCDFGQYAFIDHLDTEANAVFHPQFPSFIILAEKNNLLMRDIQTGQQYQFSVTNLKETATHATPIKYIAVDKIGRIAASVDKDNLIVIWDLASRQAIQAIKADSVIKLVFSGDGTILAWSGSGHGKSKEFYKDYCIQLWSLASDSLIYKFPLSRSPDAFALNDNGHLLVFDFKGTLQVWDIQADKQLQLLRGHQREVKGVSFTPDNNKIVSGSLDQTIRVWEVNTGTNVLTMQADMTLFDDLSISPNGEIVAVCGGGLGRNNVIQIWDIAKGNLLHVLAGHTDTVLHVSINADGRIIASVSDDDTIRFWRIAGLNQNLSIGHKGSVRELALSPNMMLLASSGFEEKIYIWETHSGRFLRNLSGHSKSVPGLKFLDNQFLYSVGEDKTIKKWNIKKGELIVTDTQHPVKIHALKLSKDGRTLATATGSYIENQFLLEDSGQNFVYIWDVHEDSTLTLRHCLEGPQGWAISLEMTADGRKVIAGDMAGNIWIWDTASGEDLECFTDHSRDVYDLALSANEQILVSAGKDKNVMVWDMVNYKLLQRFVGHSRSVHSVTISADHQFIASGSHDQTIRIWDLKSKSTIYELPGHGAGESVAFTTDNHLLVGNDQGDIACWFINFAKKQAALVWATRHYFDATQANINEAQGLTFNDIRLFQQHGAVIGLKEIKLIYNDLYNIQHEFFKAIERNQTAFVEILLKAEKLDINNIVDEELNYSPLKFALFKGHERVIEIFIKYGANVNEVNKEGVTPLFVAAEKSLTNSIILLIQAGADIKIAQAFAEKAEFGHAIINIQSALSDIKNNSVNNNADFMLASALNLSEEINIDKTELKNSLFPENLELMPLKESSTINAQSLQNLPALNSSFHFFSALIAQFSKEKAFQSDEIFSLSYLREHLLNQTLINDKPRLIYYLAEFVTVQQTIKNLLWQFISASKQTSEVQIAAANAITILNASGVNFSSLNLQGIRIPYANLENGLFDSTQLQNTDLTGVNFTGAWLRGVNLNNAQLKNIKISEWPDLDFEGDINACALSPNGQWLAIVLNEAQNINLYDGLTHQLIKSLNNSGDEHNDEYIGFNNSNTKYLAFNANSDQLIAATEDMVSIWDIATGKRLNHFDATYSIRSMAVDHQGKLIALGCFNFINIWDLTTQTMLHEFEAHPNGVECLAFNPSGTFLTSGGGFEDNTIQLWDVKLGKKLKVFSNLDNHGIYGFMDQDERYVRGVKSMAFDPTGKILATGIGNRIYLWNMPGAERRIRWAEHRHEVEALGWNNKGEKLISFSRDSIRIWDITAEQEIAVFANSSWGYIKQAMFHPLQNKIILAFGSTIKFHQLNIKEGLSFIKNIHNAIKSLAFTSLNGTCLLAIGSENRIQICNAINGEEIHHLTSKYYNHTKSLVFSPNSKWLATGGTMGSYYIWDVETGKELKHLHYSGGDIKNLAFSPKENYLAIGDSRGEVYIWDNDLSNEKPQKLINLKSSCENLNFSSTGKYLGMSSFQQVIIWDMEIQQEVHQLQGEEWYNSPIAFHPFEQYFVIKNYKLHCISLYDIATCKKIMDFNDNNSSSAQILLFNRKGDRLIEGGLDRAVRIWDFKTGQFLKKWYFPNNISSISLMPNKDHDLLAISFGSSVACFEMHEKENDIQFKLCWLNFPEKTFFAGNANITNTRGLSAPDVEFFYRSNAVGTPITLQDLSSRLVLSNSLTTNAQALDISSSEIALIKAEHILVFAIKAGYSKLAEKLIIQIENINFQDEEGNTYLHLAVANKDLAFATLLVNRNVNVNLANHKSLMPLHLAVQIESLPLVELLLAHGASPEAVAEHMGTPLQIAEELNAYEILEAIESCLAEQDMQNVAGNSQKEQELLFNPIIEKDLATTELLMTKEININENKNIFENNVQETNSSIRETQNQPEIIPTSAEEVTKPLSKVKASLRFFELKQQQIQFSAPQKISSHSPLKKIPVSNIMDAKAEKNSVEMSLIDNKQEAPRSLLKGKIIFFEQLSKENKAKNNAKQKAVNSKKSASNNETSQVNQNLPGAEL